MSARTSARFPALLGGIGLSLALMTAIWALWPHTTETKSVTNRPRPPQPTIQQAPQDDGNSAAYKQFWLEDQAAAYAKQLETASGENKRALEALLNQTLAEIVLLKGKQVAPSPNQAPGSIISVQTPKD